MANPMTQAGFPDLLDARMKEIYSTSFDLTPTTFEQVFQMGTSERDRERFSGISGHSYPTQTAERGAVTSDGRIQDFDTSLVHQKYMLKGIISHEMLKDDQFNEMSQEMTELARVMKKNPDFRASDAYNFGFTAANSDGDTMTAADGVRHFSTLHTKNPDETGTTYSNASSTGITLTEDNLNTGILALNQQRNARGQLAGMQADILLVPDDLEKQARILTGSTLRPDTADNDINVYKMAAYTGGRLKVVTWSELGSGNSNGSATRWFLLDSRMHQMKFLWREMTALIGPEYNNTNDSYEYTSRQRFSYGMVGWRGIWGSKGDGAAYSA